MLALLTLAEDGVGWWDLGVSSLRTPACHVGISARVTTVGLPFPWIHFNQTDMM